MDALPADLLLPRPEIGNRQGTTKWSLQQLDENEEEDTAAVFYERESPLGVYRISTIEISLWSTEVNATVVALMAFQDRRRIGRSLSF